MKKVFKILLIITFLINIYTNTFAIDRFVDIPVPPREDEKADSLNNQTEKPKEENTEEKYVPKSSNNYLKKLEVKNYKLNPNFNQFNDSYTINLKDTEDIKDIQVIAETDDERAKVDVKYQKDEIFINVTSENGNLKVYSIKVNGNIKENIDEVDKEQIEDKENTEKKEEGINKKNNNNNKLILVSITAIALVILIGFIKRKNKLKK